MAGLLRTLAIDVRPLRHGRFRLLYAARIVSTFGSMLSIVALPFQAYALSHSSLLVGLLGLAEFPALMLAFWGGVLADAHDRRRIVLLCELVFALAMFALVVNAGVPLPQLWPLYVVAALTVGLDAVQRPALDALVPRLVPREELPAASALNMLCYTVFGVVGPAIAGVTIAAYGVRTAYAVDVVSFIASFALLWFLPKIEPAQAQPPSLARAGEGIRYALSRRDLLGSYLVDFVAIFFGMPSALFPALADQFGGPAVLGALYAAPAFGAMLAALVSGWTARVRRHGRAIVISALVWGVAIAAVGVLHVLVFALLALAIAGAADAVSGLFRTTLWNQTVPDALRGRLAGIAYISYSSGPTLGNVEAGAVAAGFGPRVSLISGGLLCVIGVAAISIALPQLWRYDSATAPALADGEGSPA
jgi:MFS family permease